jgi:hypothetical protein
MPVSKRDSFQTLYDGPTADGRCRGSNYYIDGGGTVVAGRIDRDDAPNLKGLFVIKIIEVATG